MLAGRRKMSDEVELKPIVDLLGGYHETCPLPECFSIWYSPHQDYWDIWLEEYRN